MNKTSSFLFFLLFSNQKTQVRSKIPKFNINNFANDWKDGKALCALVEACEPSVKCSPEGDSLKNNQKAIKTAKEEMNIENLVDAEDVGLDENSMMTYISLYRAYKPQQNEKKKETPTKKETSKTPNKQISPPEDSFCNIFGKDKNFRSYIDSEGQVSFPPLPHFHFPLPLPHSHFPLPLPHFPLFFFLLFGNSLNFKFGKKGV